MLEIWLKRLAGVVLLMLMFVLIAVVCIVWTMPDGKQIDVDTEICLQNECGTTTDVLHQIFEKEILSAYVAAENQEKIQTNKYIEEALEHDVQLMTNYKNTLWSMKPSAKLVGNREEQEHVSGK
ncbi:hypothetical protein MAR_013018 [Mya arenaria]|uniref:Uncharacterized protein n=1 Tax=Mya arenaria TaxID=6604 RepID=A0ABY7G1E2_MYAAR|nr:hypothetical protein MAR_013018 [Mya arenaria]